jgi:hypothetical protein
VSGELSVSFHGDSASGCRARGLCGYSGTIVLRLGSPSQIFIDKFRRHGHITYDAAFEPGPEDSLVAAHVHRAGGGDCADEDLPFEAGDAFVAHGQFTLAVLQADGTALRTRCAGPMDGDLAAISPRVTLPLARILRGHVRLDLTGTQTFGAGGFAGTVTSTILLRLGRPEKLSTSSTFPPGIKTQRMRIVTEALTLQRTSGTIDEAVRGSENAQVCVLLDSCGLAGTLRIRPVPRHATGDIVAMGPARRPYRDFLAALGLGGNGKRRGIQVFATVGWDHDGGSIAQSGPCTDAASLPGGQVTMALQRGAIKASYSLTGSPQTRCPGPALDFGDQLALARLSRRILGRRTFTIHLRAAPPVADDGYTIRFRGGLALALRRGRITQHIQTIPTD